MDAKRLNNSLQGLSQPVNIRMRARTLAPDFYPGAFSRSGCLHVWFHFTCKIWTLPTFPGIGLLILTWLNAHFGEGRTWSLQWFHQVCQYLYSRIIYINVTKILNPHTVS